MSPELKKAIAEFGSGFDEGYKDLDGTLEAFCVWLEKNGWTIEKEA